MSDPYHRLSRETPPHQTALPIGCFAYQDGCPHGDTCLTQCEDAPRQHAVSGRGANNANIERDNVGLRVGMPIPGSADNAESGVLVTRPAPQNPAQAVAAVPGADGAPKARRPIKHAAWNEGTCCYECPACSCGAVPDWCGEAALRCAGCKIPLAPIPVFGGMSAFNPQGPSLADSQAPSAFAMGNQAGDELRRLQAIADAAREWVDALQARRGSPSTHRRLRLDSAASALFAAVKSA